MEELPLHTNKSIAMKRVNRTNVSQKVLNAIETGDPQKVIDALSEKQRLFVEAYVLNPVGTEAVIAAGYNTKYPNRIAFQLLENPGVRIAIDALRAERNKMTDVTKDYILQKIVKALETAEENKNLTAVLRAAELLARHKGMFIDKTEISGPDGKEIEIAQKKIKDEAEDFLNLIDRTASKAPLKAVE